MITLTLAARWTMFLSRKVPGTREKLLLLSITEQTKRTSGIGTLRGLGEESDFPISIRRCKLSGTGYTAQILKTATIMQSSVNI